MTFDDSGMLEISQSLVDTWKQEVNHKEKCHNCGYSWVSRARYHRTRTCPKCGEAI